MSFWDNVKKFAQPYSEDEYDDYDEEDDYLEEYEEPAEAPARREKRRAAPAPAVLLLLHLPCRTAQQSIAHLQQHPLLPPVSAVRY